MKENLRIAIAQVNPTVGDFKNNYLKILEYMEAARAFSSDVVIFPELALTGYPPEDLLLKTGFIKENSKYIKRLAKEAREICAVVGFVDSDNDIYNAAAVLYGGNVAGVYRKMYLPNYGVFDENRYFMSGDRPLVMNLDGCRIGVNICEDLWYANGPARDLALAGKAELLINISASPYHLRKWKQREKLFSARASDYHMIIAFVNLIGGQDELIFDGSSFIIDQNGTTMARAAQFREDLLVSDLDIEAVFRERLHDPRHRKELEKLRLAEKRPILSVTLKESGPPGSGKPSLPAREVQPSYSEEAEIYEALVLGTKDYVRKNSFGKVVIGLSGGIDSALTVAIAVDALGKDSVYCVYMPSEYSSEESFNDASELAESLEIELAVVPITECFSAYKKMLAKPFSNLKEDVTEENIQARIRGNILMALSNKFGWLVLSTGNKSESSVGYATIYGDMAGGFSVLKDVYKTTVYDLARYRNSLEPVIPVNSISKAPTAELKPGQADQDTLPPYEILDPILEGIVERDLDLGHLVRRGFDRKIVREVFGMVNRNEYKRRQAPPGIKITPRAFGKDRRVPLTNRYEE